MYKIASGLSLLSLIATVNDLIKEGYRPIGGITVTTPSYRGYLRQSSNVIELDERDTRFLQAMYKE
jgi:hypothetical protein